MAPVNCIVERLVAQKLALNFPISHYSMVQTFFLQGWQHQLTEAALQLCPGIYIYIYIARQYFPSLTAGWLGQWEWSFLPMETAVAECYNRASNQPPLPTLSCYSSSSRMQGIEMVSAETWRAWPQLGTINSAKGKTQHKLWTVCWCRNCVTG